MKRQPGGSTTPGSRQEIHGQRSTGELRAEIRAHRERVLAVLVAAHRADWPPDLVRVLVARLDRALLVEELHLAEQTGDRATVLSLERELRDRRRAA